ncbi:cytosine deaminase [Tardiphaga sp. 538_B7_N1_4]|jgi:cytosine deaminase|uniref:cytosine deaminase n=1 Tax=unclassified Tardiphaga TaxID=2631404 RepID=UPI001B8A084A|nr:cytosine deaminase [Bradyrhizobium diazoefficiens]MBR0967318.1 cytosine deaminase [Bradyrhizobium diazoefficiens]MBR0976639.1 cytosine deaminase [Bradyrhizobium diazoefficiens]MBR1005284.1 cytosine deaminase [Bradyrhizobium diazoefficiens]MBR1011757.1 cytosine deaminase [Bradyrhizobium diazoefficiens]MBR1049098.1 cytosine deaminase [Bradyrhizobium diazoefficiens]
MASKGFITIPKTKVLRLRRGRVHTSLLGSPVHTPENADGLVGVDIETVDGLVSAIAPAGTFPNNQGIDLNSGIVWPTFVDSHCHLDISHTWERSPNVDGTFKSALAATAADHRINSSYDDVRRRFEFGLQCAFAHGVAAIRTHVDSDETEAERHWTVFGEMREKWAGRVELQATSLTAIDVFGTDFGPKLADLVVKFGGNLGAVTPVGEDDDHGDISPRFQALLDRVFELAEERNLNLDFHVDESGRQGARALGLIARTALRRRFRGDILCGHCCSLSLQPEQMVQETLIACAEAEISVVSLPMCNMYLQDRVKARTPRWRGITLLHEMAEYGIPVAVGQDDCRNAFHAYGDHNMLEVFATAVRAAHLDRPFGRWPQIATLTPARFMKLKDYGSITIGKPANLILYKARTMSELISRPQTERVVLRRGLAIDTTLPDYSNLDDLQ